MEAFRGKVKQVIQTDVLIAGAGSGGFGAAIRLARENPAARITVVEMMEQFGGNATVGGVNCWEPGVGGLGVHYELYERLAQLEAQIGVGRTTHFYTPSEPYGFSSIDPSASYESSLRRSASNEASVRRVHFEPDAMGAMMEQMLREAGNVEILYGTKLVGIQREGRMIQSVLVQSLKAQEVTEYQAKLFIDCTGGVYLAQLAGCKTAFGEENKTSYDEPSAPANASEVVNGVSLLYRATQTGHAATTEQPDIPLAAWQWLERTHPPVQINQYPNGDLNLNVLPVMDGNEFHRYPILEAMHICRTRVQAHWTNLKQMGRFADYHLQLMFPLAGIRESHRLVGRYVLKEQDVRAGFLRQERRAELIAFADHALDTHGQTNVEGGNLKELTQPYGIPYSCLLPQEIDNLIVATRGSSFTHIAAASCRLTRTMLALGEAAGVAAALALEAGCLFSEVPISQLQERLQVPQFIEKMKQEWQ